MKIRRTRRVGTVAVPVIAGVMALTLAACGSSGGGGTNKSSDSGSGAPTDGVLTAGLLGDIGMPPDPATFYAGNGIAIMKNVYEGLVQYKPNTDQVVIAPQLATSWTENATKDVYTFKLRKDVTFHDGTKFTSAAVGPSIKRMADIKGGPSYLAAVVKTVATPDDYTAVITLKEPNSAFLNYLACAFAPKMLSPTGLTKNAGSDNAQTYLKTHDLGTGAYELTTAEIGRKYGLTQYAGYWGTKSPYKQIDLPVYTQDSALELAFDKGDVDMIVNALPSSSLSRYADKTDMNNYFLPMLATAQITTNPNKAFFKTKEARMAFLAAIDREKLVQQVLNTKLSTVATTMYARGMITDGTDVQDIKYDTSVMQAYAKTLPASENSMTVGFQTNQPNGQKMANIIAANLQTLGVHAKAQGYTTATAFSWAEDPTKGPDTFVDSSNGPDGGDPYMWGHVFWDKSGGIDFLQCDVPSVDAQLNEAVKTGDTATYVKAGKEYIANGCYLHLANNNDWILAKKWITGIAEAHSLGAFEVDFSMLGIAK
jgi:peptide/nickel transport system substrate-binding protein